MNAYGKCHERQSLRVAELGLKLRAYIAQRAPGIAWKIYFVVQTLIAIGGYIYLFSSRRAGSQTIFALVLWLIATLGVGAYVFCKRILTPRLWRYFFYLYAANSLFFMFRGAYLAVDRGHSSEPATFIATIAGEIFGYLTLLPIYIALYRYGSPKEYPWRNERD